MVNIGRFRINSGDNKKVLKMIDNFSEEYINEYPNCRYKYERESLYNEILNIYYNMGIKEKEIKKFEPVFFKEYFQDKE